MRYHSAELERDLVRGHTIAGRNVPRARGRRVTVVGPGHDRQQAAARHVDAPSDPPVSYTVIAQALDLDKTIVRLNLLELTDP